MSESVGIIIPVRAVFDNKKINLFLNRFNARKQTMQFFQVSRLLGERTHCIVINSGGWVEVQYPRCQEKRRRDQTNVSVGNAMSMFVLTQERLLITCYFLFWSVLVCWSAFTCCTNPHIQPLWEDWENVFIFNRNVVVSARLWACESLPGPFQDLHKIRLFFSIFNLFAVLQA